VDRLLFTRLWIVLFGILDNRFDIKLPHLWPNVPMVGRLLKRWSKPADESKRCTVLGLQATMFASIIM
jgi:hypothetical protein